MSVRLVLVVLAGGMGLIGLVWGLPAVRRRRERGPLAEQLALAVAALCIPSVLRADWRAEAASYLHDAATSRQRWAWCWDLVRAAPVTGAQLAFPRATARVARLGPSVRRAVDAAVLSCIGYALLSVVPVLAVGAVVAWHDGWFAVIQNADNLSVVAVAGQAGLLAVRRAAARRRPAPGRSARHDRC